MGKKFLRRTAFILEIRKAFHQCNHLSLQQEFNTVDILKNTNFKINASFLTLVVVVFTMT